MKKDWLFLLLNIAISTISISLTLILLHSEERLLSPSNLLTLLLPSLAFFVLCLGLVKIFKSQTSGAWILFSCSIFIFSIPCIQAVFINLSFNNNQSVEYKDNTIIFSEDGNTSIYTAVQMKWLLWNHKGEIEQVKVTGPGGNTTAANYIKSKLKEAGIKNTIAYGNQCNSSCTVIWTAGKNRTIVNNLRLGFHKSCIDDYCDRKNYLYEGFLNEYLLNIIINPEFDNVCPLNKKDISILEGNDTNEKTSLVNDIRDTCKKGIPSKKVKGFKGYNY